MLAAAKNGRDSVGPTIPFSRDPKARREALAKQLPLKENRMVAFHQHPKGNGNDPNTNSESQDETSWILAKITKCIGQDKNRLVFSPTFLRLKLIGYPKIHRRGC